MGVPRKRVPLPASLSHAPKSSKAQCVRAAAQGRRGRGECCCLPRSKKIIAVFFFPGGGTPPASPKSLSALRARSRMVLRNTCCEG